MTSGHQQGLREHYLAAPTSPAPKPWRPVFTTTSAVIGGLVGVGFAADPEGGDLILVASGQGRGVFDAVTGERVARDRDPDPELCEPDGDDLGCPGVGPLAGSRVRMAGLYGGGLHAATDDGWSVQVVSPDWPNHRVLLSADGGLCRGPAGGEWWHVFHVEYEELRAAGFSPSGRTLAVATSGGLALWTRAVAGDAVSSA